MSENDNHGKASYKIVVNCEYGLRYSRFCKVTIMFMCCTPMRIGMNQLLSPIVAGAGLGFGVVFLLAVANGMSGLIFNRSITEAVGSRLGGKL